MSEGRDKRELFHCLILLEDLHRRRRGGKATWREKAAESESDEERGNGGCRDSGREDKDRGSKDVVAQDSTGQ